MANIIRIEDKNGNVREIDIDKVRYEITINPGDTVTIDGVLKTDAFSFDEEGEFQVVFADGNSAVLNGFAALLEKNAEEETIANDDVVVLNVVDQFSNLVSIHTYAQLLEAMDAAASNGEEKIQDTIFVEEDATVDNERTPFERTERTRSDFTDITADNNPADNTPAPFSFDINANPPTGVNFDDDINGDGIINKAELGDDTTLNITVNLPTDVTAGDTLTVNGQNITITQTDINNGGVQTTIAVGDDVTAFITDQNGNTSTDLVVDSPIIDIDVNVGNDVATTDEDNAVTINVLANDDEDAVITNVTVPTNAAGIALGTVEIIEIDGVQQIRFTPAANFNELTDGETEIVEFTYTVEDAVGNTSEATVSVTIQGTDDETVLTLNATSATEDVTEAGATVATFSVSDEDETATVDFTAGTNTEGYYAIDGNNIVLTDAGEAFLDAGGTLPEISLTTDGTSTDKTATATPTTIATNDNPDAVDDSTITELSVDEDTSLTIEPATLLANDTDEDGDTLTIIDVQATDNTHGTVEIVNGKIVFIPDADYNGEATFTYTVSDGHGGTDTATVTVQVTPVNDAAELTVVQTADSFTQGTATAGLVIATVTTSDIDGDDVTVSLSDSPYYELNDNGQIVLTQAGADLINDGEDLPDYSVYATDGIQGEPTKVDVNPADTLDKPAVPEITNITDTDGDMSEVIVHGTGTAGNTITLYDKNNNVIGITTVNEDGTWTMDIADMANDINHFIHATQTSPAGVEGDATQDVHTAQADWVNSKTQDFDDYVFTGSGNDSIKYDADDANNKIVIDGGDGADSISFKTQTEDIHIDLSDNQAESVGDDSVELRNIEHIEGGSGNDTIIGNDEDNTFAGGAGDDTLVGGAGNDSLHGQAGDDTFNGGSGDDYLDGDNGIDTVILSGNLADYSFSLSSNNVITSTDDRPGSPDGTDKLEQIEFIQFNDVKVSTAVIDGAPLDVIASSDSGKSNEDNITNDSTPTVQVPLASGVTAGFVITLYANGDELVTYTVKPEDVENGYVQIETPELSDGEHSLTSTVTNMLGFEGEAGEAMDVTIDTEISDVTADLATQSDTGFGNDDNVTNDNTPMITGTADVGTKIEIFDGNTKVGEATVGADGTYEIETSALSDGSHNLVIKSTDVAGNESSTTQNVTVDTTIAHKDYSYDYMSEDGTVGIGGNLLNSDKYGETEVKIVSETGEIKGTYGTLTIQADGTYTYNLDNNSDAVQGLKEGETQQEVFTVTVSDLAGNTYEKTITLGVTGKNDVIENLTDTDTSANVVNENVQNGATVGIDANAMDKDGDEITYSIVDSEGNVINDGPFTIDPETGVVTVKDNTQIDFETDPSMDIIVKATSEDGSSVTKTFTVTVEDVEAEANDDTATTTEDDSVVIDVLANDETGSTITNVEVPRNSDGEALGTVEIVEVNGKQQIKFTPAENFDELNEGQSEDVSFTYSTQDPAGHTTQADVTVTVEGQNNDLTYKSEAAAYKNVVGYYELDASGNPISPATVVIDDQNGMTSGEHLADLDPNKEYGFFIIANGANQVNENSVVTIDESGNIKIDGNTPSKPVYHDNPEYNVDGKDHFVMESDGNGGTTIKMEDLPGLGDADFQDVVMHVNFELSDIIGDDTQAKNDSATTTEEAPVLINVLGNDKDATGDDLTISKIQGQDVSAGQTVDVTYNNEVVGTARVVDGKIEFTPNDAFEALNDGETQSINFQYTAVDGNKGEDTATVTVNVQGETDNQGPIANDEAPTAQEIVITKEANNINNLGDIGPGYRNGDNPAETEVRTLDFGSEYAGKTVTLTFDSHVTGGWEDGTSSHETTDTFKIFANGELIDTKTYDENDDSDNTWDEQHTYTVTLDENGQAVIEFEVASTHAQEVVDINNIEATLVTETSTLTTDEDSAIIIDVLANDTDADGDSLTITEVQNPVMLNGIAVGTAQIVVENGKQQIKFTPNEEMDKLDAGEFENVTFSYTISDGQATDEANVTVKVTGTDGANLDVSISGGSKVIETVESTTETFNSNGEQYKLGGSDDSNSGSWDWDGKYLKDYRKAIEDNDNFSENGTVNVDVDTVDGKKVTDSYLDGLDGFTSSWWSDSDANRDDDGDGKSNAHEVVDFFKEGGDLLLFQDDSGHDKIGELLGVPTIGRSSYGSSDNNTDSDALFDGSFSDGNGTGSVDNYGNYGYMSREAVEAHGGIVAATDSQGRVTAAVWKEGTYIDNDGNLVPDSGAIVIIADVDVVSSMNANYKNMDNNAEVALNAIEALTQGHSAVSTVTYDLNELFDSSENKTFSIVNSDGTPIDDGITFNVSNGTLTVDVTDADILNKIQKLKVTATEADGDVLNADLSISTGDDSITFSKTSSTFEYTLNINASVNNDSDSISSVRVSSVPATAVLSAGVKNPDGTWTVAQNELAGLKMNSPEQLSEDQLNDITFSVTTTEVNGDKEETTTSATLDVSTNQEDETFIVDDNVNQTIEGGSGKDTFVFDEASDDMFEIVDNESSHSNSHSNSHSGSHTGGSNANENVLIDGGDDYDTMIFEDDISLDFEDLAARVKNIEAIDLQNEQADNLNKITSEDVIKMTESSDEENAILKILGDSEDEVSLKDKGDKTWSKSDSQVTEDGETFDVWTNDDATVYIDSDIDVTVI